jgi:hypothetical protein
MTRFRITTYPVSDKEFTSIMRMESEGKWVEVMRVTHVKI